jgi:3-hydroxyacyl-CoA dehydrogenase / enoyl-CoA hydratase / 3-hydroxybutyryl-CoA epimerase
VTSATYSHWRLDIDADNIAWLVLDKAKARANTLSRDVLEELDTALRELAAEKRPRGLVIKSAKPTGFVLGADVKEFEHVTDAAEGEQLATQGQTVLARLASVDAPTVAAIDGLALGGGLELALACTYRVAVRGYERNIGLPEVQLGIHPGFGGTIRAVSLLGAPLALDLMLTGRSLSPVEAHSAGLVDRIVAREDLDRAAADMIHTRPPRRQPPWYLRSLNLAPVRRLLAIRIKRDVSRRAKAEHYPAPHALLDLWVRHGGNGPAAYAAEARSVGELVVGRPSKNLVRLFLLRERMRNLAPKDEPVGHVHVVGAGVMGGDIAAWCALRGLTVTVQDRAMEFIEPAMKRAHSLFDKRLREPGAAEAAKERLIADVAGVRVGDADLIIEAIVENVDAKRELLAALQPKLRAEAIVATNTSSIKLEDMAGALERPGRFVGLHFFNPVASLPLVEVVRGEETDDATERRALAFVTQIGKVPLPCRSAPGFVVNRVLMPYMLEALRAYEDGIAFETIDAAAKDFGMPMGPIELADKVGLDVAMHVAKILGPVLGSDPPAVLDAKVAAGETGIKAGVGFYRYEEGRPRRQREFPKPDRELQDRLILPLLNEAVACFADGVVDDTDLLDAGVVFGTGFAPFTGGPINYARQRGVDAVVERLEALAERHGPRFKPHEGWSRIAGRA